MKMKVALASSLNADEYKKNLTVGTRVVVKIQNNEWYTGSIVRAGKKVKVDFDDGPDALIADEDLKDVKIMTVKKISHKPLTDTEARALFSTKTIKSKVVAPQNSHQDYTILPARYSKGNMLVQCPSKDSWKTRAARLIEGVGGRYTHREKGYVVSPTKLKKFEIKFAEGWDYSPISGEWEPPQK